MSTGFNFSDNEEEPFISDSDISALKQEAEIFKRTTIQQAENLLEQYVIKGILTIGKLCDTSTDAMKFKAATYIIERVLGPAGKKDNDHTIDNFLIEMKKIGETAKL